MSNNLKDEIRKTLLLGLASHTDEFLNPGFIPGMSHEDLAKVLDRIMNSRLIERVGSLIDQKEKEAEIRGLENLLDGSAEGATCICESAGLSVCDHNWSLCNVVRDRIKQLKEELNKKGK